VASTFKCRDQVFLHSQWLLGNGLHLGARLGHLQSYVLSFQQPQVIEITKPLATGQHGVFLTI
jgi:hypothetical protein